MNDFAQPRDIGSGGTVRYGTDDGMLAEFYTKPVLMEEMSKEVGHPSYEDRVFVRIVSPGNTKTVWDFQVRGVEYVYDKKGKLTGYNVVEDGSSPCDPIKYAKAWARFKESTIGVNEGWDIMEWGAVTRSFAQTLKALNIHTVEALASLTDQNCTSIMGGIQWREKAKAALDEANLLSLASVEQERANRAEEDNRQLRKDIDGLKAQVAALAEARKGKAA